jgi:hypothetical protein
MAAKSARKNAGYDDVVQLSLNLPVAPTGRTNGGRALLLLKFSGMHDRQWRRRLPRCLARHSTTCPVVDMLAIQYMLRRTNGRISGLLSQFKPILYVSIEGCQTAQAYL